jgi:hypothetical protein
VIPDGTGANIQAFPTPEMFIVNGVTVIFTGSLPIPFMIPRPRDYNVIPAGTPPGSLTPTPIAGICIGKLDYGANGGSQGAPAPTLPGLITLEIDDVVCMEGCALSQSNSLQSVSMPALIYCNGPFSFGNLAVLTTLNFPSLIFMSELNLGPGLVALVTLSFPALEYIGGGDSTGFVLSTAPLLTTLSFPVLSQVASNFAPTTLASLVTMSFPALEVIGLSFSPTTMAALTSMSFPVLTNVGSNFNPSTMAALTTFSFPELQSIGSAFSPTTMASLVTINLPALEIIVGAASITNMAALTTVDLPAMVEYGSTIDFHTGNGNLANCVLGTNGTLLSIAGATINISGQKLTAAAVNAILSLLVSLNGSGGTTLWGSGKTLTINGGTNAAPTGQGITDKATLIARGATVTTN